MVSGDSRIFDYDRESTDLLLGCAADLLRSFGSSFGGKHLAIIGGLAPTLLVETTPAGVEQHPGTGDLDLALSLHLLDGETDDYYQSIIEGLQKLGLRPDKRGNREIKWRWVGKFRGVHLVVEFLCPERNGAGKPQAPQKDSHAELNFGPSDKIAALGLRFGKLVIEDTEMCERRVPTAQGELTYVFPVSGVTSWLCLKSDAITFRAKPKDSFDVAWLVSALGPEVVASRIANCNLLNGTYRDEVLGQLAALLDDQFKDVESVGPVSCALFHHPRESVEPLPEDPARRRYAFETMRQLRSALIEKGVLPASE